MKENQILVLIPKFRAKLVCVLYYQCFSEFIGFLKSPTANAYC